MSSILTWVAITVAVLSSLYWLGTIYSVFLLLKKIPLLGADSAQARSIWPRVSVIIPACNEGATIGEALRSHLRTEYPNIEFILINDRSTDATGEVMEQLSRRDPRISVVHIKELPANWLGKLHAMSVGQKMATGEWLLFTDADVQVAPNALQHAVGWCLQHNFDYLTAIPRFLQANILVDIIVSMFTRSLMSGGKMWLAADAKSKKSAGFGAFILLQKKVWERTQGFEWLRLEVADDVGIGQMAKAAGARCAVVNGRDFLFLNLYPRLADVKSSMEKGGYAIIGRYSAPRALALAVLLATMELGVLLAIAGQPWLMALAGLSLVGGLASCIALERWLGRSPLSALLSPFGVLFLAYYIARSAVLGWRNGGISWRGTFYSAQQLRRESRIQWP